MWIWRGACSFSVGNGCLVIFSASCNHRLRPLALYLASYVWVSWFLCRHKSSGRSCSLLFLWSWNTMFRPRSLQSILSMPVQLPGVFSGILNGSILSDFPTLNTLISVGFGACPSAPSWPGVSDMISYRALGLFASSLRRFLALVASSFF